ncbi:integumentary mucin C.1-like [Haliotis rubra]|uniref:integumentary mucin C.1-like n=1 Tax=Haliotis rubra TaxID=36100 RepID=UPI001EE611B1|nr:integumentary mucin C.1-like [Haliotis rubra]
MAFCVSVGSITMCILAFLVFVTCATTTALCNYDTLTHRQLYGNVYLTLYPGGEYRCQRNCWYSSRCVSFNWYPRLQMCQLCDSSGRLQPWNLRTSPGVVYGEPVRCQGTTHACADRPCREDEICMPAVQVTQHICLSLESLPVITTVQSESTSPPTSTYSTTQSTTSSTTTPSSTTPTLSTTTPSSTTTPPTTTPSSTTPTSSTTTPSSTITTSSTTTPTTTTTTTTKPPLTSTTPVSTTTAVLYVAEGCYSQSNSDRLLPTDDDISDNSMTIPMCSAHCRDLDKPYIALHKGKDCSCGSTLDTSGHTLLADSECDKACMGDSSTFCGATLKVSVFKNS